MKFSKSLLKSHDIALKIFKNGVSKSKELLKEVFALDFNNDPRIIEIVEENNLYKFCMVFDLNGRKITVDFNFEPEHDNDDIVSEVLSIKETVINLIDVNLNSDFKSNIDKIMDYLEKNFDINFTLLDPKEKDENIKEVIKDDKNLIWKVIFEQAHHEGYFEVTYRHIDKNVELKQFKNHKIYLD